MVCWFCNKMEENPQKSLKLSMYGEVDSKTSDAVTKVAYNVRKIDVPRCDSCDSRHKLSSLGSFFGIILFALFLISIVTTVYVLTETTALMMGIIIGLTIGLAVAGLFVKVAVLKGIKTIHNAKKSYPEVKELLIKNYKFGVTPKDYVKESQNDNKQESTEDENSSRE